MPACARPGVYVPRQTHDCDAAALVRRHLANFLARLEESGHGPLPEFVKAELEGVAGCCGFRSRLRADGYRTCGDELRVPFACRGRGFCPSCMGRVLSFQGPLAVRLDEAGAVQWLRRGLTPGPLSTTWFNQPRGLIALPGGDTLTVGFYERPGLLMLDGCLRVSEVCALQWADLDLDLSRIIVRHNISGGQAWRPKHQKKKAKPKSVGMSPRLVAALRSLDRKGALVLIHRSGRQHTRSTIQTMMRKVQKAAQVPIWSPHKFKHTGLSVMGDNGAPLTLIQGQGRHAHVSTTGRYVHADEDTHAEKAAAFFATMATKRPPAATIEQKPGFGPN